MAVGDFNRDGHPDLAVTDTADNKVSVLPGNGDGTFGAKTDYPAGPNPFAVAVGDLDGDGRPDLVTADTGANTASVLLNTSKPPAITSADAVTFTIGQAGTFTITATGIPTPTLLESGDLPTGVTFHDNGDGTATLSGTPSAGSGVHHLTFTAHNTVGPDATQSFTLTVNQPPTPTPTSTPTHTPNPAPTGNGHHPGGPGNGELPDTGARSPAALALIAAFVALTGLAFLITGRLRDRDA